MSPEDLLARHRCPPGLLEASRRPERRSRLAPIALAAAAAAAGVVVGLMADRVLPTPADAPEVVGSGARPVTFVHRADGAQRVEVAGTFNDWDPTRSPLVAMGDGVFRGVVWLPPGQYEYQLVVDGRGWRPDPLALRQRDDGFGAVNSVLEL